VSSPDPGADLRHNRALWTAVNSAFTDEHADRAWAADQITWGLFQVPERDLGVLGDVADLDVVELGCGTAYLSAWLARQGARPVGVDLTPAQLHTAARCQERFGLAFPLIQADAEHVPLHDAGFDLVVSEYGASVWCDPERWVAEARGRRDPPVLHHRHRPMGQAVAGGGPLGSAPGVDGGAADYPRRTLMPRR
jgi:SAM-dependent methyltransferase